jgi:hypothetical protein
MGLLAPVDVRGASGGSIGIQGDFFIQVVKPLDARGLAGPGGSVTISASLVHLFKIDLSGKGGDGGTLNLDGSFNSQSSGRVDASGTANGGSIAAHGGSIGIDGKWSARGKGGNGGTLTISEPDPGEMTVGKAKLDFRGALAGGQVNLEGSAIVFVSYLPSQIVVGGATSPGEIRINQTGTTTCQIHNTTLDARDSGVVEVLAPNADLVASGKFLAGPAGCVGVSPAGVVDTSALVNDVALAPSCP